MAPQYIPSCRQVNKLCDVSQPFTAQQHENQSQDATEITSGTTSTQVFYMGLPSLQTFDGYFVNFVDEYFCEALFCLKCLRKVQVSNVAITQQPEKYLCICRVIYLATVALEKHCWRHHKLQTCLWCINTGMSQPSWWCVQTSQVGFSRRRFAAPIGSQKQGRPSHGGSSKNGLLPAMFRTLSVVILWLNSQNLHPAKICMYIYSKCNNYTKICHINCGVVSPQHHIKYRKTPPVQVPVCYNLQVCMWSIRTIVETECSNSMQQQPLTTTNRSRAPQQQRNAVITATYIWAL